MGVAAKPRVYSYLRFSDPKQAAGGGVDRQLEYAARWTAGREMALDASLSLRDEGLSTYPPRHVRRGALGMFLRAVEEGRMPTGWRHAYVIIGRGIGLSEDARRNLTQCPGLVDHFIIVIVRTRRRPIS